MSTNIFKNRIALLKILYWCISRVEERYMENKFKVEEENVTQQAPKNKPLIKYSSDRNDHLLIEERQIEYFE